MKSVVIHALLAVFGLGFAYQTWTRKPEEATAPGSVTVSECSQAALQKITLTTPVLLVEIEPKREHGETQFWISSRHLPAIDATAKDAKEKKDAADGAVKEKKELEADKPKHYLANAAFGDYLKRLTPLRAQRSLGKLSKDKDKDFGFDQVGTRMQIQCGGHAVDFEAGTRAFGASQRYVRDPKSQTTYLVDEQLVSDLESAQFKFMQSELHGWKPEDVEEATIDAHGAKKRLLHRDRKATEQALWVDADAPAKRNELYNNWFSRLTKLRARVYLPVGAEPGSDLKSTSGGSEPVLNIEYKVADHPAGKLELVRVDENGVGRYYARTETTRGWVALYDSAAKEVEQDVGMVVGVEQAPASKTEKVDKPAALTPAAAHGLPPGHPLPPSGH